MTDRFNSALNEFYPQLKSMYQLMMEEEGYSKIQSFYSMIEEFAMFITTSKQHKKVFYTAMMKLMKDEELNENECRNVILSYKQANK